MSRIVVKEKSDPLLTIRLKKKKPGGGTVPYTLNGATVELYVKNDLAGAPPEGPSEYKFKYVSGTQIVITDDGTDVGDTYGELTIQCAAADLTPSGVYYFHLDVIKAAKRDVVMNGFFDILGI